MAPSIATVSPEIRSAGLLVGADVAANPWIDWQRAYGHYSRYGDVCGPLSERFNTTADSGTPPLGQVVTYARAVEATRAHLLGIDYGYSPETACYLAAMAYGRAAFLLA